MSGACLSRTERPAAWDVLQVPGPLPLTLAEEASGTTPELQSLKFVGYRPVNTSLSNLGDYSAVQEG